MVSSGHRPHKIATQRRPKRGYVKVRRALGLQLQVIGSRIILSSPRQGVAYKGSALANPVLAALLTRLQDWTPVQEAADWLAQASRVSVGLAMAEVERLVKAGLLVEDQPIHRKLFAAQETWERSGWSEPFLYHAISDAVKRVDYSTQEGQRTDVATMRHFTAESPPPPKYMPATSDRQLALAPPSKALGKSVSEAFVEGDNWGGRKLLEADLSTILWFGFGQVGAKKLPVTGKHLLKVNPSGGSRHPTESYLLLWECADLPRGIYHYGVRDHSLEHITNQLDIEWIATHIAGKAEWMTTPPAAVLVLTSRVELSMYRYRENFSYRPIHHDIGHVLETITVVALSLGYAVFTGYSMNTDEVCHVLGNQRLMNPPIAFAFIA